MKDVISCINPRETLMNILNKLVVLCKYLGIYEVKLYKLRSINKKIIITLP